MYEHIRLLEIDGMVRESTNRPEINHGIIDHSLWFALGDEVADIPWWVVACRATIDAACFCCEGNGVAASKVTGALLVSQAGRCSGQAAAAGSSDIRK